MCVIWINDWIVPVWCDDNNIWHPESPSDVRLAVLSICLSTVYELYFCFVSFPFRAWLFSHRNMLCGFVLKSLGYGKAKVEAWQGCVTFPSDDATQFTGCSRLSLLYYLWLQTSPRSSCSCYYQHDWVTQQLLHFLIWKLGSTHRSIATHPPPHPSRLSLRPEISVLTVTHQLFKKTTFNL